MRLSRIIAGLVGLLATLLVFALAVVALEWPESLRWLPHGDVWWMPHMGGWWGVPGWSPGVMLVGLTLLLLLFALPLVVLYGAVSSSSGGDDVALQRLRERYASGDIDDEEFERRRRRLEG